MESTTTLIPNYPAPTLARKPTFEKTFENVLQAALEHARRLTSMHGTSNINVAIAWETVEELQTAKANKSSLSQSAFERYCAAHPDAPESRIYDC
ncbi:MAG: Calvin cycle protein CP12 [Cyanobacteria bacterium P01_A01_bin.123]